MLSNLLWLLSIVIPDTDSAEESHDYLRNLTNIYSPTEPDEEDQAEICCDYRKKSNPFDLLEMDK